MTTKAAALARVAQLLATEGWERVRPAARSGGAGVPGSPQEITPQWLSRALATGTRVRSVRVVGGSTGTTTRGALEVSYDAPGDTPALPRRLFVKCTSTVAQRLMLGLGGFIHGEVGFYTAVRPGLEIEAPAGYFGAVDERSWRSIVVTEDVVATRGARFWAPGSRLTRPQVEDLLENAARWHGATWASPGLERWRWLKTPAEQMRVIDSLVGLANRAPVGARRARAVIPPRLRDSYPRVYDGMRRSMEIASRGPLSYLHGDLHIANTYLTADGRMGVADWQIGLKGSWVHDYAYILMTALEVEDRRAWERDLLDRYLDRLRAAGGAKLRPTEAWLAYRQATFYPYFAWAYTLGRARLQPAFQPEEVSLTMIARIAAAIDDLDSLGAVGL